MSVFAQTTTAKTTVTAVTVLQPTEAWATPLCALSKKSKSKTNFYKNPLGQLNWHRGFFLVNFVVKSMALVGATTVVK